MIEHPSFWYMSKKVLKIRNEKGDIRDTEEIQKIIIVQKFVLYSTKLENVKEIDNLLDRYHMPN